MDCSIAQCLEVVGEWWSLLIIRDGFYGITRFDVFQQRLGISRNILQQRLQRLCDAGIFEKVPYCERPLRHDYRLTEKGRDLFPILMTLQQWGDRYAAPAGRPVQVVHRACGSDAHAVLTCPTCGQPVGHDEVEHRPGAGRPSDRPLLEVG